jgi:hypothetical protein
VGCILGPLRGSDGIVEIRIFGDLFVAGYPFGRLSASESKVVETGAALGAAFPFGMNLGSGALEGKQVPHQRRTLVRDDKLFVGVESGEE